jgi:sugar fermentation stimulation protein A
MRFHEPVHEAEFLRRYQRFFADVRLGGGETLVAHVPNTGSLKSCLFPGGACVISESSDPRRKLKATLQLLRTPTSWVGVNTGLPNALVHEAWSEGRLPAWKTHAFARREYKISPETRLDLVLAPSADHLSAGEGLHYVEIKSVTYAADGTALFPDAVTARGQKHLRELMELKKRGAGAEIVFVVQRQDCAEFAPADEIDPVYGRLLREAADAGVRVSAYACAIDPLGGVTLDNRPLDLSF